ncbi:hypothetical protein CF386_11405 [Paraphotobacterium marinum]|uniref:ABC transporter domain-containing protein n=1 Tax=Paraphotobacterium marinum TaxID=1755811 RepID=A0A220VI64_9GAMM|nr:ABC transporter ATP-binding protein [Paraphotobacterium marinum]ASK79653.1 hypothetical protein CF386_11405 [Paraphotobacterium marinum]
MIEIIDLSIVLNNKTIIQDINLKFYHKQIFGLIGHNGSGKTTLLKAIMNDISLDTGKIYFNEKLISRWNKRELAKSISLVPQHHKADHNFNCLDYVLLGRIPHQNGRYNKLDYEIAYEAIEMTGAIKFINKNFNNLSGGEQAKIKISKALAQLMKPELSGFLLLDEPSANMDLKHQQDLILLLNNITKKHNIGVILIIHDLNIALNNIEVGCLLHSGKIVSKGDINNIITEENVKNYFGIATKKIKVPEINKQALINL